MSVRFPPVLKIDTTIPAEFQEQIRKAFPNFVEKAEVTFEIPPEVRATSFPEPLPPIQPTGIKNYEFSSEDGKWKVNLTRSFIALSTSDYTRWNVFQRAFAKPLRALIELYEPHHFSRIGLRYLNVIKRSEYGLDNFEWKDLLQPFVLGIAGMPEVSSAVQKFESGYEIQLDDQESVVRLIAKLQPDSNGEASFVIDSDLYNTNLRTGVKSTRAMLYYFNTQSAKLFEWCITDRLREAMGPEVL